MVDSLGTVLSRLPLFWDRDRRLIRILTLAKKPLPVDDDSTLLSMPSSSLDGDRRSIRILMLLEKKVMVDSRGSVVLCCASK